MKRILSFTLAILVSLGLFACTKGSQGSSGESSGNSDNPTIETITIHDVTVDLSAPENKVAVSQTEKSTVKDSDGRTLTDKEWLLNSKFAKSYIQSLGSGEYVFTYETSTKKGTIKLIITDKEKPGYLFGFAMQSEYNYLETVQLPYLVKDQDNYQGDYVPTYKLYKGAEEMTFNAADNGFVTDKLSAGSYLWKAVIEKGDKVFEYSSEFRVKTFEEWLASVADSMLFNKQTNEFIKAENGKYVIDTTANGDMYSYTVDNSVLQVAMTAGKTAVKVEVLSDVIIDAEKNNGDLWLSNGWRGYVWAFSGVKEYVEDKSAEAPPRISGMQKVGDNFNYYTTGYLKNSYFSAESKNPLQLDFANGAKAKAIVTISFL